MTNSAVAKVHMASKPERTLRGSSRGRWMVAVCIQVGKNMQHLATEICKRYTVYRANRINSGKGFRLMLSSPEAEPATCNSASFL